MSTAPRSRVPVWGAATFAALCLHSAVVMGLLGAMPRESGAEATRKSAAFALQVRSVAVAPLARPQTPNAESAAVTAPVAASPAIAPVRAGGENRILWDGLGIHAAYLPSGELDRAPQPYSAPDEQWLEGVETTGLPIRLRLYIEADGRVSNVIALQASFVNDTAVERLRAMFLATAFVPGRQAGVDVASFLDIDVEVDPVRSDDHPVEAVPLH